MDLAMAIDLVDLVVAAKHGVGAGTRPKRENVMVPSSGDECMYPVLARPRIEAVQRSN